MVSSIEAFVLNQSVVKWADRGRDLNLGVECASFTATTRTESEKIKGTEKEKGKKERERERRREE